MKYSFFLRLKIQEDKWITMGDNHIILWDIRDLIVASSGWFIMNQDSMGLASAFVPKLQKGILELTLSSQDYARYEMIHGLGTLDYALEFYQNLLEDCRQYPYTELCGRVIA